MQSFADNSGYEELRIGVVAKQKYMGLDPGKSWHISDHVTDNCAFFLCLNATHCGLRKGGTLGPRILPEGTTVREGGIVSMQLYDTSVRFWLSDHCTDSALSPSSPQGYLELSGLPSMSSEEFHFAVQFHNHADVVHHHVCMRAACM